MKGPKYAYKIPPTSLHHQQQPTSHDGNMLSCWVFTKFGLYHPKVRAEMDCHPTRKYFSNLFFLSSFGEHVGIINSVSFSQLTYCIVHLENLFCKPLILTIGYLTFCCLHISSQQSAHSPLISCINKILVK